MAVPAPGAFVVGTTLEKSCVASGEAVAVAVGVTRVGVTASAGVAASVVGSTGAVVAVLGAGGGGLSSVVAPPMLPVLVVPPNVTVGPDAPPPTVVVVDPCSVVVVVVTSFSSAPAVLLGVLPVSAFGLAGADPSCDGPSSLAVPASSAQAMPGAVITAVPMPKATAKAPTRPTYFAQPTTSPPRDCGQHPCRRSQ